MIDRDAEPTAHVSPYRRIEIGPRVPSADQPVGEFLGDLAKRVADRIEAERIWALVKQSAGGTEVTASVARAADDESLF